MMLTPCKALICETTEDTKQQKNTPISNISSYLVVIALSQLDVESLIRQQKSRYCIVKSRMFQRLLLKRTGVVARYKCRPIYSPEYVTHLLSTNVSISFSTKTTALTDAEQQFYKEGIMDERGLVQFDTLHNMQVRSCRVYAEKDLFATYSPTSQKFEWMTFAECM
jgi:hypothetical protein